jgi:hypothetical protein
MYPAMLVSRWVLQSGPPPPPVLELDALVLDTADTGPAPPAAAEAEAEVALDATVDDAFEALVAPPVEERLPDDGPPPAAVAAPLEARVVEADGAPPVPEVPMHEHGAKDLPSAAHAAEPGAPSSQRQASSWPGLQMAAESLDPQPIDVNATASHQAARPRRC